jgi:hypothetical protein
MTYLLVFLAATGFSGHCLAMCGAFPLALHPAGGGALRAAGTQLLYHLGKTSTYVFLGVLAAAAGLQAERYRVPLGVVAAASLILVGLANLVPSALPSRLVRWVGGSPLCAILSGLLRESSPASALSVGVFNGFIPCGLVTSMLAYAATLESTAKAALVMLAFGAGTVPALALLGVSARLFRSRFGYPLGVVALLRVSAALLLAMGALTLYRTFGPPGAHIHPLLTVAIP